VIRGIAAGLVLVGHVTLVVFPARTLPADASAFYRWLAPSPWAGVWIFFTLSGYLMGKGLYTGRYRLESGRIAEFYRNRALRIAPLFFVAVLLVAALKEREIFQPAWLWNLADLLSFDSGSSLPINLIGALWSVSTEVQFYLLVPLLAWALFSRPIRGRKISLALLLAVAVLGLAERRWVLHWLGARLWNADVLSPVFSNLDLFAIGLLFNPVCDCFRGRLPVGGTTKFLSFVAVAAIGYALLASFTVPAMIAPKPADFFAMVGLGPTVIAAFAGGLIFIAEAMTVVGGERPALRRATALPAVVGLISYSLYVWHEPIILGLRPWFPPSLSEIQTFLALLACLGAVTLAATASFFLIERPFERLKFSSPNRRVAALPTQSASSADRKPSP
jgi:peptidoglycan/LPS O-acetylase OafA/YrhL